MVLPLGVCLSGFSAFYIHIRPPTSYFLPPTSALANITE
jgi:hypothetical protein